MIIGFCSLFLSCSDETGGARALATPNDRSPANQMSLISATGARAPIFSLLVSGSVTAQVTSDQEDSHISCRMIGSELIVEIGNADASVMVTQRVFQAGIYHYGNTEGSASAVLPTVKVTKLKSSQQSFYLNQEVGQGILTLNRVSEDFLIGTINGKMESPKGSIIGSSSFGCEVQTS